ncbi:hypothetical protein ACHAXA_004584, partial [Cyclostephanos tholiformis]
DSSQVCGQRHKYIVHPNDRVLLMTSLPRKSLSIGSTWGKLTESNACMARFVSRTSTGGNEGSDFERTAQAILSPLRLAALEAADVKPVTYNKYSFFADILVIRGRNITMLVAPLLSLFLWGLGWQLFFLYGPKNEGAYTDVTDVQEYLVSIETLVEPLITPLAFLLVFRLGRAAVRYWESRQAAGKMVEICRTIIATVNSEFMSPIRLRNKRCAHTPKEQARRDEFDNEHGVEVHNKQNNKDAENGQDDEGHKTGNGQDDEALKLLCEFSCWLAVFPIAVKFLLRPDTRKGWENSAFLPYLVIITQLFMNELAYDLAHFQYNDCLCLHVPTPTSRAIFHQKTSEQINVLFEAFGAMERIQATPLPFAYVVHLRSFLIIYLFLINMIEVAKHEWVSLPFLFLFNWSLLGVEAAAVECESPFDYKSNHLTLGNASVLVARNIGQALKEMVHQ